MITLFTRFAQVVEFLHDASDDGGVNELEWRIGICINGLGVGGWIG